MKLLHVDSSPKGELSNSKYLGRLFVDALKIRYPTIEIDYLDLAVMPLPHIDGLFASAAYKPEAERTKEMKQRLQLSDQLCNRILAADTVVMCIPMHNWCYPSVFKAFIDHITRGGLTYLIDEQGHITGRLGRKKILFITTRGGDLGPGSPLSGMDALTPTLKAAFQFIGAVDMTFVDAQPLQFANQEAHQAALQMAKDTLLSIAESW